MTAAAATQSEIRAAPLHQHSVAAAARVNFFHHKHISDLDIHIFPHSFPSYLNIISLFCYFFNIISVF
jgi:hypothetical protein